MVAGNREGNMRPFFVQEVGASACETSYVSPKAGFIANANIQ